MNLLLLIKTSLSDTAEVFQLGQGGTDACVSQEFRARQAQNVLSIQVRWCFDACHLLPLLMLEAF